MIALRALGWAALLCALLGSVAGAVLLRPARRWTTPRELVVSRGFLDDDAFEPPVSFEGWSLTPAPDGAITVRRGPSEALVPWSPHVLVRSDEAGTFLDAARTVGHCGRSQAPRMELRAIALLLGLGVLTSLTVIGSRAQRRLEMRAITVIDPSPTYRSTGQLTPEARITWAEVTRDARISTGALLAAAALVATWSLVFAGVL